MNPACFLLFGLALVGGPLNAQAKISFDRQIAPVLAANCLDCHNASQSKGGLNLRSRATAFKGGESGKAIKPGSAKSSLLWRRIADNEMPPKHPLSAKERKLIRQWIVEGAKWGSDPIDPFRFSSAKRAGYDWWSLRRLQKPALPKRRSTDTWPRNEIDHFVLASLAAKQLGPSPRADARTLVRRLYFDLLGLPAPPKVIAEFARNPSQQQWQELVSKLLASRHYGERWARHWLDVARFGESHGYEYNVPRENAWHYRDWVIRSLNRDLPYDEFARLQLAADILKPDSLDGAAAVGFLVAGIHNTVVGRSKVMKMKARQEELAEMAAIVGQTFLGLTVHCARCHDHKFDPISTAEYYQFIASLSGVHHGERKIRQRSGSAAQFADLVRQRDALQDRLVKMIEARVGTLGTTANQLLLKKPLDANRQGVRYRVTMKIAPTVWAAAQQATRRNDGILIQVVRKDGTILAAKRLKPGAWKRGGNAKKFQPRSFDYRGDGRGRVGIHLRPFPLNSSRFGGALDDLAIVEQDTSREVFVENFDKLKQRHPPGSQANTGQRVFFGGQSSRWNHSGVNTIHSVERESGNLALQLFGGNAGRRVVVAQTEPEKALQSRINALNPRIGRLQSVVPVFTVAVRKSTVIRILKRGDVTQPGAQVAPHGLKAIRGVHPSFEASSGATDQQRRAQLARWITNPNNGPFHRVIVNRVWHHHFGRGIVDSPNDLGFNGGRPSHPRLLDWLSVWFREHGYSLKKLHRLIVTSATYQQTSLAKSNRKADRAVQIDKSNRLLWRQNPRRVDAETLRDSMLDVAGVLNRQPFGRGFLDSKITRVGSAHYYIPIDPTGPAFRRRTIYRWQVRGQRSSLLESFDCPDPSTTTPSRSVTTTPAQALSQWNHSFVLRMSKNLAARVRREAGKDVVSQVKRAWMLTLGRAPDGEETTAARQLVEEHGLALLGRVLFNSNEWIWIE